MLGGNGNATDHQATKSNGSANQPSTETVPTPSFRPTRGLRVSQWTNKVVVHDFGAERGKGLVASTEITNGEVIWKEDPWAIAPEWDIFDLQWSTPSRVCAHCTTPFAQGTSSAAKLIATCPGITASSHCPARFCNRLCLARAQATHHPLLCPIQNPGGARLIKWARRREWLALHALTRVVARVLLSYQQPQRTGSGASAGSGVAEMEEMDVVRGWAAIGMEDRIKTGAFGGVEPDRETWKAAHEAFLQAFREPLDTRERRSLAKILSKPIPESVSRELFVDYESFLFNLGRMSLNMEAHGGLYVLHSHLNHSCDPNVSARHLDRRTALSRITLCAKRDIGAGEELTVSYVDPEMGLRSRRAGLLMWGFGQCQCERCVREEAEEAANGGEQNEKKDAMVELEKELKAGLGLM